jgi:lysophospholipase L1-like esterase
VTDPLTTDPQLADPAADEDGCAAPAAASTGAVPRRPRVWTRYVALGDSLTEGLVDADPAREDGYVGWADRLAAHLDAVAAQAGHRVAYANLAVRGRLLDDIVGPQLEAALAMEPDLVSIVGGGNDIMRPSVDLTELAERLETAVVRVRATGADVLLATPTDPREAGLFRALRPRHAVHAANILTIAQRHGAHVLNLWGSDWLRDWRMWGADRIHPTSEAHRRLGLAALLALGHELPEDAGPEWAEPLPPAPAVTRRDELREHGRWVREHAGPWVQRRLAGSSSGDTLAAKRPTLTPLRPS